MNRKKEPFFEAEGVFYTYSEGAIAGYAYTYGDFWHILPEDGEEFCSGTLYLDRDRKITAPHNPSQMGRSSRRVNTLVEEYTLKVDRLTFSVTMLNLETLRMKLFMAETYLIEYRSIKFTYFAGNALKFILF